jgi:hypothetical protein
VHRVVDENIDAAMRGDDRVAQAHDRRLVGLVERVAGRLEAGSAQRGGLGLAGRGVARRDDDVRARLGQRRTDVLPVEAGATGHDGDLAVQPGELVHGPWRGGLTIYCGHCPAPPRSVPQ